MTGRSFPNKRGIFDGIRHLFGGGMQNQSESSQGPQINGTDTTINVTSSSANIYPNNATMATLSMNVTNSNGTMTTPYQLLSNNTTPFMIGPESASSSPETSTVIPTTPGSFIDQSVSQLFNNFSTESLNGSAYFNNITGVTQNMTLMSSPATGTFSPFENSTNMNFTLNTFTPPLVCNTNYTWIWETFGQCVVTSTQCFGFVIGLLSIFLWIGAHISYIRAVAVDYHHGPGRITLWSLSFLVVADLLNFMGCVTSNQLPTMVIISVYLLIMDIARFCHSLLLRFGGTQWCLEQVSSKYQDRWDRFFIVCPWLMSTMTYMFGSRLLEIGQASLWTPAQDEVILVHRSRMLLGQISGYDNNPNIDVYSDISGMRDYKSELSLGYVMGILTVPLYFIAILPDLLRVFQSRRSTKHMVTYYICALIADVMYLISIYTQSLQTQFLLHTLPWTVARTGVCGLHIGVLIQILISKATHGDDDVESRMSLLKRINNGSDDDTVYSRSDEIEMTKVPKKNRYIKKMRKMGKQIENSSNPFEMESSDDGYSDEEESLLTNNRKSRPHGRSHVPSGPTSIHLLSETDSDGASLNLDLEQDTLRKRISEEEIVKLLEDEYQHFPSETDQTDTETKDLPKLWTVQTADVNMDVFGTERGIVPERQSTVPNVNTPHIGKKTETAIEGNEVVNVDSRNKKNTTSNHPDMLFNEANDIFPFDVMNARALESASSIKNDIGDQSVNNYQETLNNEQMVTENQVLDEILPFGAPSIA